MADKDGSKTVDRNELKEFLEATCDNDTLAFLKTYIFDVAKPKQFVTQEGLRRERILRAEGEINSMLELNRIVDLSKVEDKKLTLRDLMNKEKVKAMPEVNIETLPNDFKVDHDLCRKLAHELFVGIDVNQSGVISKIELKRYTIKTMTAIKPDFVFDEEDFEKGFKVLAAENGKELVIQDLVRLTRVSLQRSGALSVNE
jgi:hypothetical protein